RLVQPHNLAFWVYCVLVAAGAHVLAGQISIAAAAYSGALISGLIAFGLLAVAYLWFIHYEDRYTTVPRKLAAAGFVWGFVGATGAFALLGNDAVMSLYAKAFGASFAFDWGAALAAPIDEELAKGAGILLLLTLAPKLIRSPFDGLILGAFVGLGFQISEDISYAWIGAADAFGDVGATWSTIVVRTLSSIPSHWMFTAVFGAGLVWFIGRPDVPARKGLGAGLMLTAMLMHGLWDASAAIAGNSAFGLIVPVTVAAVLITVFVWIYENTAPIERDWMRELMAPEVERGVVTPAELDALAGTRTMLRSYIRAQPNRRTAEHVLDAETELAHRIARDGGAETAAVQQARAEVGRARGT
ncbi:MAG TPA: PrsW family intramembrane metalloprotease, partial [Solirubrobacteraceae bacterium]|nr:PrsW family intramembrane metalloprotease [Solirubrobacteraceae bacterium]